MLFTTEKESNTKIIIKTNSHFMFNVRFRITFVNFIPLISNLRLNLETNVKRIKLKNFHFSFSFCGTNIVFFSSKEFRHNLQATFHAL